MFPKLVEINYIKSKNKLVSSCIYHSYTGSFLKYFTILFLDYTSIRLKRKHCFENH